jgi:hypothetical protein
LESRSSAVQRRLFALDSANASIIKIDERISFELEVTKGDIQCKSAQLGGFANPARPFLAYSALPVAGGRRGSARARARRPLRRRALRSPSPRRACTASGGRRLHTAPRYGGPAEHARKLARRAAALRRAGARSARLSSPPASPRSVALRRSTPCCDQRPAQGLRLCHAAAAPPLQRRSHGAAAVTEGSPGGGDGDVRLGAARLSTADSSLAELIPPPAQPSPRSASHRPAERRRADPRHRRIRPRAALSPRAAAAAAALRTSCRRCCPAALILP